MDIRANGIILRKRRLTETSLILHWLTREQGRVATVAKGALRPKSPFRGKLDLFFECDLSYARSRRSDLHTLREAAARSTHPGLRLDLKKLQQAAYAAAFIEQVTETETPVPEIHGLFTTWLAHLEAVEVTPLNVFAFELKLLEQLGQGVDFNAAQLPVDARQVAQLLVRSEWDITARLQPAPAQLTQLRQFLHGFLIYHLDRLPKGRAEAAG
jgi:DNA repair protein RecO (recombination protein O)